MIAIIVVLVAACAKLWSDLKFERRMCKSYEGIANMWRTIAMQWRGVAVEVAEAATKGGSTCQKETDN